MRFKRLLVFTEDVLGVRHHIASLVKTMQDER